MKKAFYSHIVDPRDIHKELDMLELTDEEKMHLSVIVESTAHHVILDAVLEQLHDDHKHVFLTHIAEDNQDDAWALLEEVLDDPKSTIRESFEALKEDFLNDIKSSSDFSESSE